MAFRFQRTDEERERVKHRCLEAWNADEASRPEIARAFHVGQSELAAWVQEWLAAGLTTRQPRQQSTRASRTGRL